MPQTSYVQNQGIGIPGQLADIGKSYIITGVNKEGAGIPFGLGLVQTAAAGEYDLADAAGDVIAGIGVHTHDVDQRDLTGAQGIPADAPFSLLVRGAIFVRVEEAVAVTDPVYARVASDGATNTQIGGFRKSSDSGRAVRVRGARWLTAQATAGGVAILYFDALAEKVAMEGQKVEFVLAVAQQTADATLDLAKLRSDREFILDRVDYINPTGLAANAANFATVKVQTKAGTPVVLASRATDVAGGALTADTWTEVPLTAAAATPLAAGTALSVMIDATGTVTLPAGTIVVHGRYL